MNFPFGVRHLLRCELFSSQGGQMIHPQRFNKVIYCQLYIPPKWTAGTPKLVVLWMFILFQGGNFELHSIEIETNNYGSSTQRYRNMSFIAGLLGKPMASSTLIRPAISGGYVGGLELTIAIKNKTSEASAVQPQSSHVRWFGLLDGHFWRASTFSLQPLGLCTWRGTCVLEEAPSPNTQWGIVYLPIDLPNKDQLNVGWVFGIGFHYKISE